MSVYLNPSIYLSTYAHLVSIARDDGTRQAAERGELQLAAEQHPEGSGSGPLSVELRVPVHSEPCHSKSIIVSNTPLGIPACIPV